MSKKIFKPDAPADHLVVFQEKIIRRTWHENTWWFAIVDVVAVLTDSVHQPEGYVKDLRRRDKELAKGWGQIATPFGLKQKACNFPLYKRGTSEAKGDLKSSSIAAILNPPHSPFVKWGCVIGSNFSGLDLSTQ